MTTPRGPVYLVLPREPLSASLDEAPAIVPRPVPRRRASRSGGDRAAGRVDRQGRAAADHHGGPGHGRRARSRRWRRSRSAPPFRSCCAQRALGRAAVVASDACRVRLRAAGRRRRPDHRDRERRAVVSGHRSSRPPAAASRISARTRRSCAIRCARSRAICRSRRLPRSRSRRSMRRWRSKKLNVEARRAQARSSATARAAPEGREGSERERAQRRDLQRARSARRSARTRSSSTNIRSSLDHCAREKPGTFYGLSRGGRARLGPRRRARRQARGAGEVRGRDRRRRRLHVHQSDRVPLGRRQVRPAGAHGGVQQQPLRRGAARDALDVQGRRGGRGRRPVPRRSLALAAVRGIRARAGRPRRARRDITPSSRPRSRARATRCAAASRRSSTFSFPTDSEAEQQLSCASTRTRISSRRNISRR